MSNLFEFDMKATQSDPEGYYYPRWDLAERIKVKAETKDKAIEKARAMLGSGRWPYIFSIVSINEVSE